MALRSYSVHCFQSTFRSCALQRHARNTSAAGHQGPCYRPLLLPPPMLGILGSCSRSRICIAKPTIKLFGWPTDHGPLWRGIGSRCSAADKIRCQEAASQERRFQKQLQHVYCAESGSASYSVPAPARARGSIWDTAAVSWRSGGASDPVNAQVIYVQTQACEMAPAEQAAGTDGRLCARQRVGVA